MPHIVTQILSSQGSSKYLVTYSCSVLRAVPSTWRFALVGALASLLVTVFVNWLPNSKADMAGGIMIFSAFIAEVLTGLRSTDPDAAGFRAGGVLNIYQGYLGNSGW